MKWDFSNLKAGQMVNVQAYKHNGFLYRQWNGAKVIFHNKRHIVLFLKGTSVTETQNTITGWRYTEHALWFIPKRSWYNGIVLFKKNVGNYYYINMASYPIFEDNTIKFIDYDLDIKCYPEKELQVVDRDEFTLNSRQMNYGIELKSTIYNQITQIISMFNNYEYFFNYEILEYYLRIAQKDKLIDCQDVDDFVANKKNKHYFEDSDIFKEITAYHAKTKNKYQQPKRYKKPYKC